MSLTGVGENSIGSTGGFGYQAYSRGATSPKDGETAKTAQGEEPKEKEGSKKAAAPKDGKAAKKELSPEETKQVSELRQRDQHVRAHEQAHISAGGQYVRGGASYDYQTGPDGKRYAVGGEVSIDTSPEKSPEATIAKMEVVKRAALAPADPSAQDRSVAASATQKQLDARMELAAQAREAADGEKSAESQGDKTPENEAGKKEITSSKDQRAYAAPAASGLYLDSYA